MPAFPKFDLPKVDFPVVDLSKFKLPFDFPKVDIPKVDFSRLDLSGLNLSGVELPSAEQVIAFLRDAAYAGTGLAALTAERIADLQKQLLEILEAQIQRVRPAA